MRVRKRAIGKSAGHQDQPPAQVDAYELDSELGPSVVVWTYGATLVEVRQPDRHGRLDNIVLRHSDLSGYEGTTRRAYLGSTMGRFCRKVADGMVTIDGTTYQLSPNDSGHHIHGGVNGFDRCVWEAQAGESPGAVAVHLRLVSRDGDQGYPGELTAEATYQLEESGRLTIEYRAVTDAPTIIGLTSHSYWNLVGAGPIGGHELALNASRILLFDSRGLPRDGPPEDVAATRFDYRAGRPVGDDQLDNFFPLDSEVWAAELYEPEAGRRMRMATNQPGIAVYSADKHQVPRTGVCLQASAWPDAPNRPDFPTARLAPGEEYLSRTVHEFSVG
jgi:aldose 1-epimerase